MINFYIKLVLAIIMCCCFCLAVKAESHQSKNELYSQYMEQAKEFEAKHKLEEAKEYYEKAHKIFPFTPEPMLGILRISISQQRTRLEIKYYEKGLEKNPEDTYLLEDYAKYLKGKHKYDKTLEIYNRLYDLTKNNKYKLDIDELISLKKSEEFSIYYKQAKIYEANSEIEKANEFYLKAHKILPRKFEGRFGLAKTYGWLAKHELALNYYEELLKEFPENIELQKAYKEYMAYAPEPPHDYGGKTPEENIEFGKYYDQAKKYEAKSEIEKANEFYLKAHKIIEKAFEARFGLAKTYGWLAKHKLASQYYEELLKDFPEKEELLKAYKEYMAYAPKLGQLSPKDGLSLKEQKELERKNKLFLSYIKQAAEYEQIDQIKQANKYYLKAEAIFPDRFEALFGLAKTYGKLRKDILAVEYYGKVLQQEPDNIGVLETFVDFLREAEYYEDALKILGKLVELTNDDKYKANIADIFMTKKDYLTSLKLYYEIYKNNPQDIQAQKHIGLLHFIIKDYIKAIEFYSIYLNKEYDPESILNYAKSLFYAENPGIARELLEDYLKLHPDDTEALRTLGKVYLTLEMPEKAVNVLKKAIILLPDDTDLKIHLARSYIAIKNYNFAEQILSLLAFAEPDNVEVFTTTGDLYMASDRSQNAIVSYSRAILLKPKDINIKLQLARAYTSAKNYRQAGLLLESLAQVQPNNADIYITMGDLYMASDKPNIAIDSYSKAVFLKPNDLNLKIQLARAYIADKNTASAKNILLVLNQSSPDNIEVKEILGDISISEEDYRLAINYYQSIPNFQKNSGISFKIAQAHQYAKNYSTAQYLYKQFFNNPEYSTKAKIALAEIELNKRNPKKARKMLWNILAQEPDNTLAKKNLGVSYSSTGDNFKAIEILKDIPRNEDVDFSLASAYNAIERKDKALELLEGNSLKYAKTLESEIKMEIRPQLAPLYDWYREAGNANALAYHKMGAKGYLYHRPNLRSVTTAWTSRYFSIKNVASSWGTLYGIGLEGRPKDKLGLLSNIAVETFNYKGSIVLGDAILKLYPTDYLSCDVGFSRILDERDSFMSAPGVVPVVGPFAGQLVGRITNNKFKILNLSLKLPYHLYSFGSYNLGYNVGSNSPANAYQESSDGIGYLVFLPAEKYHGLTEFKAGYDLYYLAYKVDRSGFGGADLTFNPVGSDGISPIGSPTNPAVGGYFSPTFFLGNTFGATLKGRIKDTKWKYLVAGFIGTQSIKGIFELAGTPARISTRMYYGYAAGLTYNEDGRLGLDAFYRLDNYRTITQRYVKVNLIIRF